MRTSSRLETVRDGTRASTSAQAGADYELECRIRWPDGSEHWIATHGRIYSDAEGRHISMQGVVREITEYKRLEEELRQSQKMDAIGRLAGGVAHDFNNLLSVIRGYGELLERELSPGHSGHRRLREIRRAIDSATALTRQTIRTASLVAQVEIDFPKPADMPQP
jgi:signal transduction histidine kinase